MRIVKRAGKLVKAYRLGKNDPVILDLMDKGQILLRQEGLYEIFTREANGPSGQLAREGDYVKLDSDGYPYPNSDSFFQKNHRHVSDDVYEQIPKPLEAWSAEEQENEVIHFLREKKGLKTDPENPNHYFSAPLWGTTETAEQDAIIVFYQVERGADGKITDVDFNFVARSEFEKSYRIC